MPRSRPVPPPRLVEHELFIPDLDPRHDGLRIAHLSDIHVGKLTPREHVRAAVELANAAEPDVIVMTGDYVCWRRHEVFELEEQIGGLRARRVVATLGNHDYFTWGRGVARALASHGYDVLKNQHATIDIHGAPLHLIGIDDPITRQHDPDAAFAGVSARGTRVVLCHGPEAAPRIAERGADLVLSGHTHGGQINVPGVTERIARRMGLRYLRGFYEVGDRTRLYVTPGVGFSGVTLRSGDGTSAEVALFTLRVDGTAVRAA